MSAAFQDIYGNKKYRLITLVILSVIYSRSKTLLLLKMFRIARQIAAPPSAESGCRSWQQNNCQRQNWREGGEDQSIVKNIINSCQTGCPGMGLRTWHLANNQLAVCKYPIWPNNREDVKKRMSTNIRVCNKPQPAC